MTHPTATPNPTPLLQAYKAWKALQDNPPGVTAAEREFSANLAKAAADDVARRAAAIVKPADIERRAFNRSIRKVAKRSRRGDHPAIAVERGYRHYRKHGGSASLAAWRSRVAAK